MLDSPDAVTLVQAVRNFLLEQAMPRLAGHTQFHTRVAANVLGIVERELTLAAASERAEQQRLEALLGTSAELEELNRLLAQRIRAGEWTADDEELHAHLWSTTLEKLAVDNPRYQAYRRAVGLAASAAS